MQFLGPYRKWAILAPALMLLEVAMDLAQPWMMGRIIEHGTHDSLLNTESYYKRMVKRQ